MYIGENKASFEANDVKGNLVKINDEDFYKIENVDQMRPFFMSIVSNSNHWMFISSNGGLSAGRKNSNYALFPYYTDDKITESAETTGSKTIVKIHSNNKIYLWEPFSNKYEGIYEVQRNLYKNSFGNKVLFEEINLSLGVAFRYEWNSSSQYGFVKKSTLVNNTEKELEVTVLDGLQNIMPYGVSSDLQNASSNLVDAYKKCELETDFGIGIFALSAIIVDRAEPSEALKANIVWSYGIEKPTYLLCSKQLSNFRKGSVISQEIDVKAEKGAYLTVSNFKIPAKSSKKWLYVANVNQSMVEISEIKQLLQTEKNVEELIEATILRGTNKLIQLAGAADGIHITNDKLINYRHFSNTLFNIMRGGIFDFNYQIEKSDFTKYILNANNEVFNANKIVLEQLPETFNLSFLNEFANNQNCADFKRLCFEYLPLKFSRRHGDPSRPWNKFSINTKNEIDGSKILDYEGNWRDIFQNWEALAHSYPAFIENMIHKFLNATTFEGYNPYRVTKGGFDWETVEPDNPWSYIGYWGDHQIIYLLKFLEIIEKYFPNKLANYFSANLFVYANVPYKIKNYQDTLKNPKDTIVFDFELDETLNKKKLKLGADGTLLTDKNSNIYHVNLIEKLLATVLSKVSNFIPEGGIWMNTQRPEWNDANNALVGNGVSMVTLYYLRRFLKFFEETIEKSSLETVEISIELVTFFNSVVITLQQNEKLLTGSISDNQRKIIMDGLGEAGSTFRTSIYKNAFSAKKETVSKDQILNFAKITLQFIDHSIKANKRDDNLYHAYNLMTLKNDKEVSISYLSEMLEGQVAVLSSGFLNGQESLEVLNSLKASALFRPDQYSYILYPNKELPRFSVKNNIDKLDVENSKLLTELVKDQNYQVITTDCFGNYHFNGNFNNADSLKKALSELPEKYNNLVKQESDYILAIFEKLFNHKAFTGRSGTFFGYEGLGSIYWHMVSKLLLAVQESSLLAVNSNESEVLIGKLLEHYYEINEGIGVHKSPKLYGAFPTDPYSHTPGNKGVQQPGMTGQVKEDIISRFGELGVSVNNGKLQFNPRLLRGEEFLKEAKQYHYFTINKEAKTINLEANSICFSCCQVPIIYKISDRTGIDVLYVNNEKESFDSLVLSEKISAQIFNRTGEVENIIVYLKK